MNNSNNDPDILNSKILKNSPSWYRGDFHIHTDASHDGTYPVSLIAGLAKSEGLDFCAITDHNTIDAFSNPYEDLSCLIIPGLEVTFKKGHFNVFGIKGRQQWMNGFDNGQRNISINEHDQKMALLMEEIQREGLLNSINHPLLSPWDWQFGETDLRFVHCLEIWNDPYWPDNIRATPDAISMWTSWLNAGHRITAIGGSDYHCPPKPEEGVYGERLGLPSTYVYAEELSVDASLQGLSNGQVYVTRGPKLNLEAEFKGNKFGIGDDLGVCEGKIEFKADILNSSIAAHAKLIRSGVVIVDKLIDKKNSNLVLNDSVKPSDSHWYRLDLFDKNGAYLAITNPIFVGPPKVPNNHRYKNLID